MVADAVNPARKTNGLADIGLAEGGAGVAAVTVHRGILKYVRDTREESGAFTQEKSGGKAHDEARLSRLGGF